MEALSRPKGFLTVVLASIFVMVIGVMGVLFCPAPAFALDEQLQGQEEYVVDGLSDDIDIEDGLLEEVLPSTSNPDNVELVDTSNSEESEPSLSGESDLKEGDLSDVSDSDGGDSLDQEGLESSAGQDAKAKNLLAPAAVGNPYLSVGGHVFFDGAKQNYSWGNASYIVDDNSLVLTGQVGVIDARYLGAGFNIYLVGEKIAVGYATTTMNDTAIYVMGELIVDGSGKAEVNGALVVELDNDSAGFSSNGCFTKKGDGTLSVLGAVTGASRTQAMVSIAKDILIEGGGTFFRGSTPIVLECGGNLKVTGGEYFYVISFSALGAQIEGNVDFLGGKNNGVLSIGLGDTDTEQYQKIKLDLAANGFADIEKPFMINGANTEAPIKGAMKAGGIFTVDTKGAVQIFRIFDGFGLDGVTDVVIKNGTVQIFSTGGFGAKASEEVTIAGGDVLFMGIGGSGLELSDNMHFLGGTSTILGLIGAGDTTTGIYGLKTEFGNVNVGGGNHTVVGTGMGDTDWGMSIPEGSMRVHGGKLLVIGPTMGGLVLDKGGIVVSGGTLEGAGAYVGISAAGNIAIQNGIVNAFARGRLDPSGSGSWGGSGSGSWGELYQDYFESAQGDNTDKALGIFLDATSNSGSNKSGYALVSHSNIVILDSTVNAFAFLNSIGTTPGSNLEVIGIHADGQIIISSSTVVALADTNATSSTTIGIHSGVAGVSSGRILLTGSTSAVTAYAFQQADTRLAMYVENADLDKGIILTSGLKIAAGPTAPGKQIPAYNQTNMTLYPYVYATAGKLYLDDVYVKWDYMDQMLVLDALCFDPPNGHMIITREMMQSLVALDRFMILTSDNVDISKGSWIESIAYAFKASQDLDPNNSEAPIYYSPAFKGMGVVFIFKTGRVAGESTIHQVDGVELYDFGTRYDTDPEHAAFSRLTGGGKQLIHSIHFNYTGEYPASMQLLLAVGEEWKNKQVSWYYLDASGNAMVWILDQKVDPFGWLVLDGIKQVPAADTAITSPGGQPQPAPTPALAKAGDAMSLVLLLVGALAAVCLSVVLFVRRKHL